MTKNKTIIGKGWMRKRDWDKHGFFNNENIAPTIFRTKGKKEDWDDQDWPPVKVEFEIKPVK